LTGVQYIKAMQRDIENSVLADLEKKMVFLGGPRQVGKTTLSKTIFPKNKTHYFNWDNTQDRKRILELEFPPQGLLVLDEVHKYKRWRGLIKGYYDTNKFHSKVNVSRPLLVTGSARLDFYRFGGDSLQGRYHYWRLHPLSLSEVGGTHSDLIDLMELSGFPEPFFSGSQKEAHRWIKEYRNRFLGQDLRDLEAVQDVGHFELMTLRLPELVGAPLSINGLREDLQIAHKTLVKWLGIYERLYGMFRVAPFGAPTLRAVKKEQKPYLYCWTYIEDAGARFENLIACQLLKYIQNAEDREGRDLALKYFRDTAKQEVDFVVVDGKTPKMFLEVKLSDAEVSSSLIYLARKFPKVPAAQISLHGKKDFVNREGIRVCPAHKWLMEDLPQI
jgi:predicted AAA+ superfamily ATPase